MFNWPAAAGPSSPKPAAAPPFAAQSLPELVQNAKAATGAEAAVKAWAAESLAAFDAAKTQLKLNGEELLDRRRQLAESEEACLAQREELARLGQAAEAALAEQDSAESALDALERLLPGARRGAGEGGEGQPLAQQAHELLRKIGGRSGELCRLTESFRQTLAAAELPMRGGEADCLRAAQSLQVRLVG